MNEQVARLYADVGVKISGALRGLREFRTRLQQGQSGLKTLRDQSRITGAAISTGITAVLGVLGSKAVTSFADAEKAMNVFKLATGASADEMARASAAIEAIAHDLSLPGITKADAANALMALGNAGLSATDAINALRPALLLAEAGEIKGAEAAELLTAALSGFSLPGTEAARVVDLLAGAALAAQGSVRDIGEAVRVAGPIFAAAGVPIETLVTGIALLAKNGIVGANAGEQLKSMMLRLINPTEEASGLMAAMGVHVYDAQGKLKDFREIIREFQAGLAPLTEAQRNQRLATIFGSEAVSAAAIIFQKEGVPGFDKMKEAVTQAGTAQALATAKTEGLAGATGGLTKAIDTASTDAVKPFAEDIKALSKTLTEATLWFNGLDADTQKTIITVGLLAAALPAVGFAFSGVGAAIGGVLSVGGFLLAVVDAIGVGATLLATGPLGLLILALGGLAAVLAWAYNNNETFRNAVDTTFRTIDGWVAPLRDGIHSLEEAFRSWSGVRVDFGAILQGIPIVREVMAIWAQLRAWGVGGNGHVTVPAGSSGAGGVGGSWGAPVTVGGGAQGFVNGQPIGPANHMAGGGSVMGGQAYLVGERGPELFVPGRSGAIVPNGAGGQPVNVNFYGQVFGFSDVKDMVVRAIDEARREGRVNA